MSLEEVRTQHHPTRGCIPRRVGFYFEGKREGGAAAVEIGEWEGGLEEVLPMTWLGVWRM